jgi:hypothetical protein
MEPLLQFLQQSKVGKWQAIKHFINERKRGRIKKQDFRRGKAVVSPVSRGRVPE